MATDNSPDPPLLILPSINVYSIVTLIVFMIVNLFTVRPVSFPMRLFYGHGNVFRIRIDYATASLVGALFLLAVGALGGETLIRSALQPLEVLLLFFSMAYLCISLDLTGVLRYIAQVVLRIAGASGRRLLIAVFLLASVLTIFSSNDIVVLTLSPLLLHMARQSGCNPLPFLFTCFYAANTMSMIWYLGNSTNVIIAMAFNINPLLFSKIMGPVALIVHILGFIATAWYFRTSLPTQVNNNCDEGVRNNYMNSLVDPIGGIFLTLLTIICMIVLFIAGFANLPVWAVTSIASGLALIRDIAADIMYPTLILNNNNTNHTNHTQNNNIISMDTLTYLPNSHHQQTPTHLKDILTQSPRISNNNRNRTLSGSSISSIHIIRRDHGMTNDAQIILPSSTTMNELNNLSTISTSIVTNETSTCDIERWPPYINHDHGKLGSSPLPPSPSVSRSPSPTPRSLTEDTNGGINQRIQRRLPRVYECMKRVPWAVLPFLVGEFAILGALEVTGIVAWFGHGLGILCQHGVILSSFIMVIVTTILCTGISNLPTTVLLTKTLVSSTFRYHVQGSISTMSAAQFAIVLGSNVGPCLSLPGCLAGLIWAESLAANGVPMRPWAFSRIGLLVITGPLIVGALVLGLVIQLL